MSRTLQPWLIAFALMASLPAGADDSHDEPAPATGRPVAGATAAEQPVEEPESEEALEQRKLIEEFHKEQAVEQGNLAAIRKTAAFREVRAIDAPADAGQILAFHPLAHGGIVIATGAGERYGETSLIGAVASLLRLAGNAGKLPPTNQLTWLDASGEASRSAPLPFSCKGVTVAPDGAVIAVGEDRVVVFSADGEQVAEAAAPHFQMTADELAQLREEMVEQHREQLEATRQTCERLVEAQAALEQVPEEERTPRQQRELVQVMMMVRSFEARTPSDAATETAIDKGLAKARAIHRVAASADHLFLVANEPTGYGYGVWRCGRDFSTPEKIVDGLRGCCGQMDVQVVGDALVIAENGRHHVAVYALDGEPLRTFGEACRTDIRKGFGGCCNPMNACPGPDGSLLLSESNGLVKQFAADGTLVEILASANVQSGCKNSSIGLSTDGATLYYLDINRGRVLVLEKKS